MNLTSDWHIHSRNSCDDACLAVSDLIAGAAAKGVRDFGLTDHIHTPFNLPDLEASRREFLASPASPRFHFGAEASSVSQWELDEIAKGPHKDPVYGLRSGGPAGAALALGLTEQNIRDLGIEYVVAGTHWPIYVPMEREALIRDYHRQNMFLAAHPLVDIVAHPWWWMGHWQEADGTYRTDPWLGDFRRVPKSMHDEFAAAAIQYGAVVEINLAAMLLTPAYPELFKRQYLDYLGFLRDAGVTLSIGSDCHSGTYDAEMETAAGLLDKVGIRDADLWRLPPRAP